MAARARTPYFVAAGLLLAFALAFFAAPHASSKPDGLNKVAADRGFADAARDSEVADGPLAGYGVRGIDDSRVSTGTAGIVGVTVTFLIGGFAFVLIRRGHPSREGQV